MSVPVLSKKARSTLAMFSMTSPPRATTPAVEAADNAVACGTGAASKRAHGQETTHSMRVATMSPEYNPYATEEASTKGTHTAVKRSIID